MKALTSADKLKDDLSCQVKVGFIVRIALGTGKVYVFRALAL